MLGKISSIVEIEGLRYSYHTMEGYLVSTDKHSFSVLIESGRLCCESYGYFSSEDDPTRFVGSTLLEVRLTDVALNTKKVEESDYYGGDCGGIQFVDFVTDIGVFQLAVYNEHNGYYGHDILVLKDTEVLLKETL